MIYIHEQTRNTNEKPASDHTYISPHFLKHYKIFPDVSFEKKSLKRDISYLDSLQRGGGLWDSLWHIKAFGGTDFGIDQPLLEVPQSRTEPLLQ